MEMFKLLPSTVSTIWGGQKLKKEYGIETDLENCAEAWMLSCFPGRESVASTGVFKGLNLKQIIDTCGSSILGKHAEMFSDFPVLIKFIDAADDLSVQVHPDNEYAKQYNGGFGKTECWYILDCEPGAKIIYGFNGDYTREEFAQAIAQNKIEDIVNYVEVSKGDFFFIESGTLHAICKGIVLAEVQQNSDITFRAYDYNRFDVRCNGPRPLHIKETLDVTMRHPPQKRNDLCRVVFSEKNAKVTELVKTELFTVNKYDVNSEFLSSVNSDSFVHLLVTDGNGTIKSGETVLELSKGEGVFIPADTGEFTLTGSFSLLETRI